MLMPALTFMSLVWTGQAWTSECLSWWLVWSLGDWSDLNFRGSWALRSQLHRGAETADSLKPKLAGAPSGHSSYSRHWCDIDLCNSTSASGSFRFHCGCWLLFFGILDAHTIHFCHTIHVTVVSSPAARSLCPPRCMRLGSSWRVSPCTKRSSRFRESRPWRGSNSKISSLICRRPWRLGARGKFRVNNKGLTRKNKYIYIYIHIYTYVGTPGLHRMWLLDWWRC